MRVWMVFWSIVCGLSLSEVLCWQIHAESVPEISSQLQIKGFFHHPVEGPQFIFSSPHISKVDKSIPLYFKDESLAEIINETLGFWFTAQSINAKDLWVNLSPNEPQRQMSQALQNTRLGEVLLSQDFLLKQWLARSLDPRSQTGQNFWQAWFKAKSQDLTSTSLDKVWILPDRVKLGKLSKGVYIQDSQLRLSINSEDESLKKISD